MKRNTLSTYKWKEKKRLLSPKKEIDKNYPNECGMEDVDYLIDSSDFELDQIHEDLDPIEVNSDNERDNEKYYNEDMISKEDELCHELRSWSMRNKINPKHVTDLLRTLKKIGFTGLPNSARELINTSLLKISSHRQIHTATEENLEVLPALHSIIYNQTKMQQQLDNLKEICLQGRKGPQGSNSMEKMLIENLVLTRQTYKTTSRLLGTNLSKKEEEMASLFPLCDLASLDEMENVLQNKENSDAMRTYLISTKGNRTLDGVMRGILIDECFQALNWDGRHGKKSLRSYTLFGRILQDVFKNLDRKEFEKQMRKCCELSHNRQKQKNYKLKKEEEMK